MLQGFSNLHTALEAGPNNVDLLGVGRRLRRARVSVLGGLEACRLVVRGSGTCARVWQGGSGVRRRVFGLGCVGARGVCCSGPAARGWEGDSGVRGGAWVEGRGGCC